MIKYIYVLLVLLSISACVKRPVPETTTPKDETGAVAFSFDHMVGNAKLSMGNTWYTTANSDSLRIDVYAYYISNIRLTGADGKQYSEPESYHLVDELKPDSKKFTINNIPAGNYTAVSFMIGVDSARNRSGAQTGALDPIHGMFWDWNTGYIMAKLEGTSPSSAQAGMVLYHMGGFSGPNNSLRTITLQFPTVLTVKTADARGIHIKNDVLEWFQNPVKVSIKEMSTFRNASDIKMMADNYADMFTIDHID